MGSHTHHDDISSSPSEPIFNLKKRFHAHFRFKLKHKYEHEVKHLTDNDKKDLPLHVDKVIVVRLSTKCQDKTVPVTFTVMVFIILFFKYILSLPLSLFFFPPPYPQLKPKTELQWKCSP